MSQKPEKKEDIEKIIKQLEGVYKTTKDEAQRKRVGSQLVKLKRSLENPDIDLDFKEPHKEQEPESAAPAEKISVPDIPAEEEEETEPLADYETLKDLNIVPIHNKSKNYDVNFFAAVLNEFEDEFWPALSEYHLKLDYNYSKKRDAFFDKLELSKITLKELMKVFEQLEHSLNATHEEQLDVMRKKQEREFIMKMVEFLSELRNFLKVLIKNYDEDGNIIVEPEEKMKFDKLYGEKKLSDKTIISAIRRIFQFVTEAMDASGFSNFYKKGE